MQIRIPLFLFIFSEELSRSFLPLFVARLSPESTLVSDELLIGLPITLFMLMIAVVTPIGGGLTDRFGARRVFLGGIVFAVVSYAGTFFVQGYYDLLFWRTLGGLGYGLIYIAAQVWVTENSATENRAQGMAVFSGAIFVGAICGPPIGSIIAGRIGFEATFLISAMMSVIAGLIIYQVLNEGGKKQAGTRTVLSMRDWRVLLADTRFLAVTLFAALPMKMVLTGFLYYIVPLYLNDLGNSQTAIGWVMMAYGVATVGCTTIAARYADRSKRYSAMVLVGGALAGIGCVVALFQDAVGGGAVVAVVIAVVAFGLGHAVAITSQLTIAQKVADSYADTMGRASVVSAFRLVERGGFVLGPLVAGALVTGFGYQGAMVGIGLAILAAVSVYVLITGVSEVTHELRGATA
ncbi:MAG: MFS transporter, partial [bacterium]